jgi:hypothetical protein
MEIILEFWEPVPLEDYEKYYLISTLGRVISLQKKEY